MRAEFEQNGYAVVEGFLEAEELTRSLRAVESLCARVLREPESWREDVLFQRDCRPQQLSHLSATDLPEAEGEIYIIGNISRHSAEIQHLLFSRRIIGLAAVALGEPVSFHFSNLTLRSARFGCSVSWHRDYPNAFCCGADERQLRLVICLHGMSRTQGAVEVIEESHRWSDTQWEAFRKAEGDVRARASVHTIECSPGSVVVLGCRTIHGALPNTSRRPRANIIAQYGAQGNPLKVGQSEWP